MGLETGTFINSLVVTNPTGNDGKSQGDDHLRLLKSTIKNTFPNVTGAVTATHTQLNATTASGVLNSPGMVILFAGSQAQIPAGWQLCNGTGTTSTGIPVPDLRSKFIQGATGDGGVTPRNSTGGALTHNHTLSINGTALTIAQIPAHTHSKTYTYVAGGALNLGFIYNDPNIYHGGGDSRTTAGPKTMTTSSTGSGAVHTHTGSTGVSNNVPPYFALMYIIKL